MKITLITYSKTWQERQYEPERIEATAEVQDDKDPSEALQSLKDFVHSNSRTYKAREVAKTKKEQVEQLRKQINQLQNEIEDEDTMPF